MYEIARGAETPPLEQIIAAAELVGAGAGALDEQRELLKDDDSAVRYWAAVGLRMADNEESREGKCPPASPDDLISEISS